MLNGISRPHALAYSSFGLTSAKYKIRLVLEFFTSLITDPLDQAKCFISL